jgi:hypothetical protein
MVGGQRRRQGRSAGSSPGKLCEFSLGPARQAVFGGQACQQAPGDPWHPNALGPFLNGPRVDAQQLSQSDGAADFARELAKGPRQTDPRFARGRLLPAVSLGTLCALLRSQLRRDLRQPQFGGEALGEQADGGRQTAARPAPQAVRGDTQEAAQRRSAADGSGQVAERPLDGDGTAPDRLGAPCFHARPPMHAGEVRGFEAKPFPRTKGCRGSKRPYGVKSRPRAWHGDGVARADSGGAR